MKINNCAVCRIRKTLPDEWFCSNECQLKYSKDPDQYCIIYDAKTSKMKNAHWERLRLLEQQSGRKLTSTEGIIMTCENQECINMSHSLIATRLEKKNFWEAVRAKRERTMWIS